MSSPVAHGISDCAAGERELHGTEPPPLNEAVREQLERILTSSVFRNSKRYSAVLTYIVEQKLAGNHERLKERAIGVDVFGRPPDYDTASDHVVRSAMAEVRKRLAQYYQEKAHASELRFELQPGSYVPQFHSGAPQGLLLPASPAAEYQPHPKTDLPGRPILRSPIGPARPVAIAAVICAIIVSAALLFRGVIGGRNVLTEFWRPVLASKEPVLLCLGNVQGGAALGQYQSPVDLSTLSMGDFHRLPSEMVHVMDAAAVARLTGFLQARSKPWWIATQSEASLDDLRKGPVILIGLMNNDWTERIAGNLRFRAEKIAPRTVVIRDTQNPAKNDWSMDYSTPLLKITRDYALVLRIFDPNTGEPVVSAAGISVFGTQAAAEFLTDTRETGDLDRIVPGWERKNLEIVLSTEVVRAKAGVPHMVAARAW